jgi:hypothetical protein
MPIATPTVHQRGISTPIATIATRNRYVMVSQASAADVFVLRMAVRGHCGTLAQASGLGLGAPL